ncbi:protein FAM98B [Denticeps clupeoides]|uniref:Family with sequence similarity 98 member B n=1 Tax=Denticeps clupeoides TaxID=299321 RepID=A0AAY4APN2_9TELE|nr:protein FAM98B [Denticeps clupeoides]
MEGDVLDALDQVGYDGPLRDEASLCGAADVGLSSPHFASLCDWLTARLQRVLYGDGGEQQLEVGALLDALCCPFPGFASMVTEGRLKTRKDHLKLLLFLVSELQAAHIVHSKTAPGGAEELKDAAAPDIQAICRTLNLSRDDRNDPDIFSVIQNRVKELVQDLPHDHVGNPVLKRTLTQEQWAQLEKVNGVLSAEYQCRRRMLIKRLDVTVQSFGWSDRAKQRVDTMARAYQPKRRSLTLKSSISLAHLLAAREDICHVVKTSSGSSREKTACALNKVRMGRVPDRGGRPSEIEAPPPEMPPWQKRQDGGGGGGRGGWRGGGGKWRGGGGKWKDDKGGGWSGKSGWGRGGKGNRTKGGYY